jgi:hypothetical protein
MAGKGSGRGGSGRSSGGMTAAPARQMNRRMVDRGIRVTYNAQGDLVNDRLPSRLNPIERQAKAERMSARLRARRQTLLANGRRLDRQDAARVVRMMRKVDRAAAKELAGRYSQKLKK